MLPQCEGLGLLHILQVGSAVQLRGMHGPRRQGGWGAKWQIKSKYVRCTPYPYLTHTHTNHTILTHTQEAFLVEGKPGMVQGI